MLKLWIKFYQPKILFNFLGQIAGATASIGLSKLFGGSAPRASVGTPNCQKFMSAEEHLKLRQFFSSLTPQEFLMWKTRTKSLLSKQKRDPNELEQVLANPTTMAAVWWFQVNGSTDCKHKGTSEKAFKSVWDSELKMKVLLKDKLSQVKQLPARRTTVEKPIVKFPLTGIEVEKRNLLPFFIGIGGIVLFLILRRR